MRGVNVTEHHMDVSPVLSLAETYGIPTLGIGDGGNEVGMGVVEEFVRRYVPYGNMCNCPCRGGITSSARTSRLIVSPTSNWGAYALTGIIWKELKVPQCLSGWGVERAVLSAIVCEGAVDGVTGEPSISVDSFSPNELELFHRKLRDLLTSEGPVPRIP